MCLVFCLKSQLMIRSSSSSDYLFTHSVIPEPSLYSHCPLNHILSITCVTMAMPYHQSDWPSLLSLH